MSAARDTTRPKHSPIGASSMHRWAVCPGSVRLSEGLPNTAGVAAQEGSAAHELVSLAMERAFSEGVSTLTIMKKTVEAVNVYSSYIESIRGENPYHIEHGFDLSSVHPMLYGTGDFVMFDISTRTLHVIDYKHGEGVPVEVKNNKQLQYYALGALLTLPYKPTHVQMTIVQPRIYHPEGPIRSWRVPAIHFIDFEADLIDAAKATEKKNAKIVAGSHCIFCPAKSICKEYGSQAHKNNLERAKRDFNFYQDPKNDFEPVAGSDSGSETDELTSASDLFS